MNELSIDEFTVLLLANEGESMIPIGMWKKPILALTERGLMRKNDEVNYEITAAGRSACDKINADDDRALHDLLARRDKTIEARAVPFEEDSEGPLLAEELKDGGT